MTVRYPDSVDKVLHQLGVVAKQDLRVGKAVIPYPKAGIVVSPTFWRKYGCALNCGGCSPAFTLDYLPTEWEAFCRTYPEYADDGRPRTVYVNGEEHRIYTIHQERAQDRWGKKWCQYLRLDDETKCGIHRANPFSCRVELIHFRAVKTRGGERRGYIHKGPYGRAWAMTRASDGERGGLGKTAILCWFEDFDPVQFRDNDLPALRQMLAWANHFGVETWLPEILEALVDADAKDQRVGLTIDAGQVALVQEEQDGFLA